MNRVPEVVHACYRDDARMGMLPVAKDTHVVRVGSERQGEVMQCHIKIEAGSISDVRFQTLGCPYAIACNHFVAHWLLGKSVGALAKFSHLLLIEQFDLPKTKYHCAYLAEDLVKAIEKRYIKEPSHV